MSHKSRFAKIRALVHFMSLRMRAWATEKMALRFITSLEDLSTHLSPVQDLPPCDLLNLDENASSRNVHLGNVRWNGNVESDIVGREDGERELLARLTVQDNDQDTLRLRFVSVVGEEAIGKTALVRSVFNRLDIDHSFQCRVWVHVPEEFTLKDLLVRILKQTPQQELKDLEHIKEENLKEILHKSLMELRYLIVFDNLHEANVMDELMILLVDSKNGSRVVITTPVPEIPALIDPWASPLKLNKLDADQSKRLLRQCGPVAEDPGLMAGILSKCSGSPLSILLLGGIAAASNDSSPVMEDQHADNHTLHDIVSLSYHKLPSLVKPCLLSLCLFPKDKEIPTRRLFRQWLAKGLVEAVGFTAIACFEELVGRNLVQVVRRRKLSGRPKSCRVPSFLHDFLCKMATQLRLLQIHSDTQCTNHSEESKVVNGCSSWIVKYQDDYYHQGFQKSAETEDHQHSGIHLQHLRSYVSFKTQKHGTRSREVEELLRSLIAKADCCLLRVLDLEGVYKPSLPAGLGNVLLNLRYLGLRWAVLDSIPESVGNMSRLETLDLKHTKVRNLPSSIWKAKSLQHLYMNEVCFNKSTNHRAPLAEYPNNLQTFWGLYVGAAKSPMLDVLSKLSSLEKLGLTCNSPAVKEATECMLRLTMLRSLKLRSRDLFGQPSDLNLSNMTGLEWISELYLLGGLPEASLGHLPRKLKILTLSLSGLGKFESLEILNLFAGSYNGRVLGCSASQGVKEAYVDKTALCCLEELEIKRCGRLTSIYSLDHIESLKQIRLIEVKEKLAKNIKDGLPRRVFIKEDQLVISRLSAQATQDN
ncbi:hypothetical protein ACJRO7_031120 [Eucalyptus globulus]|uniref:NB-ARC domain-containing protein n=1 Tax=Eucalyptus globulus TaxID=34317 RepID=A0ABD3JPE2_EUCGL